MSERIGLVLCIVAGVCNTSQETCFFFFFFYFRAGWNPPNQKVIIIMSVKGVDKVTTVVRISVSPTSILGPKLEALALIYTLMDNSLFYLQTNKNQLLKTSCTLKNQRKLSTYIFVISIPSCFPVPR